MKKALIVCDTDLKDGKIRRQEIEQDIRGQGIDVDAQGNMLSLENVHIGYEIYTVPQNGVGAVEKVLLQILQKIYPQLSECAEEYREQIMSDTFTELRRGWATKTEIQELYADKVQLGAAAAVLKPDRPVGYVVKDCLIRSRALDEMLEIGEFKGLYEFLSRKLQENLL